MSNPKPIDDYTWADTPLDPSDVVDPAAKRAAGWQENDPLPYNGQNWIQRMISRWFKFLEEKFTALGDLSLEASNGAMTVAQDDGSFVAFQLYHNTPASDAQLRADQLLADSGLRCNAIAGGIQPTGDLEFVGAQPATTCGEITAQPAAGHGTLTHSGLTAEVFKPSEAAPATADQATAFRRDEALYRGNLIKLAAEVVIEYDGSGVPSILSSAGHNLASATIVAASGSFPNKGVQLVMTDTSQPTVVVASRGYDQATAWDFVVETTPLLTGARVGLRWYNSGTSNFQDALLTTATLANERVVINVIAL